MKKLCTLLCAAALTVCMVVPAFAATDDKAARQENRQEITETKKNIKEDSEALKSLKAENKTLSAEYKAMKAAKKNGTSSISKEHWKEIKALSGELKTSRAELKGNLKKAKELRKQSSASIKAKDLEKGLSLLEESETAKENSLDASKEINRLLKKITAIQ